MARDMAEVIEQAREALLYVLEHLNPDDRFNIVEFSTGAREYARELVAPSEAEDATRWVERLGATGGTDINLALLTALDMVEPGRPTMILFLTDGLPTEGEIDTSRIIAKDTTAIVPALEAAQALIEQLGLRGVLFTADALHCQKNVRLRDRDRQRAPGARQGQPAAPA
jgi:Ca-activated chloride channel family protein